MYKAKVNKFRYTGKKRPDNYKLYSIEEVHKKFREWEQLGTISNRKRHRILDTFDGYPVKTWSQRYTLFLMNTKCVCCGLEKEWDSKAYHFNLYYVNGDKEILFTKDHIIPASKGGLNTMENYQTMCSPCNYKKGATICV